MGGGLTPPTHAPRTPPPLSKTVPMSQEYVVQEGKPVAVQAFAAASVFCGRRMKRQDNAGACAITFLSGGDEGDGGDCPDEKAA